MNVMTNMVAPLPVTLLPATTNDELFLFELYKISRAEEMAFVNWNDAEKNAFLRQQFDAKKIHYQQNFPTVKNEIIMVNGRSVGLIDTVYLKEQIRLLDIVLLPEVRNQGIGSVCLRNLQDQAERTKRSLRLHVLQSNHAALRFYRRHACRIVSEKGVHYLMEWKPSQLHAAE